MVTVSVLGSPLYSRTGSCAPGAKSFSTSSALRETGTDTCALGKGMRGGPGLPREEPCVSMAVLPWKVPTNLPQAAVGCWGGVQGALCPPVTPLPQALGAYRCSPSVCQGQGGTTHLFVSTVVRVKGTPLSSSTMKSRWQKGQWPTLSPSSLACGQRGRAQLAPLPPQGHRPGRALRRVQGQHPSAPSPVLAPGRRAALAARGTRCPRQGASPQPPPAPRASAPHPEPPAWHSGRWPWHPQRPRGPGLLQLCSAAGAGARGRGRWWF